MKKQKKQVKDLSGAALDYAVATIEKAGVTGIGTDGKLRSMSSKPFDTPTIYSPSTNWAQAGEIIDRERIRITPWDRPKGAPMHGMWGAGIYGFNASPFMAGIDGETPLIAAMRVYVASKLGNEVDIPDELC